MVPGAISAASEFLARGPFPWGPALPSASSPATAGLFLRPQEKDPGGMSLRCRIGASIARPLSTTSVLTANSLSVKNFSGAILCRPDLGEVRAAPLTERNPGRLTQSWPGHTSKGAQREDSYVLVDLP